MSEKKPSDPVKDAVKAAGELIAADPKSETARVMRTLVAHIAHHDGRFAGILKPAQLLARTYEMGDGFIDGLCGMLDLLGKAVGELERRLSQSEEREKARAAAAVDRVIA